MHDWSASVISTVSSDTEPTIQVAFDSGKYLFNAGENTARAFTQSSRHIKGTKAVFLTGIGTQRTSGLPGLLMLLADGLIPHVDVIGPAGILHFLAIQRSHFQRQYTSVNTTELQASLARNLADPPPVFKDDNITVYGIPLLHDAAVEEETVAEGAVMAEDAGLADVKRKRTPSPVETPSKRARTSSSIQAMSSPAQSPLSPPNSSDALSQFINSQAVHGHTLSYDEAQAWRHTVVAAMFPGDKRPVPEVRKTKGTRSEANLDTLAWTPGLKSRVQRKDRTPPSREPDSRLPVTKTPGWHKQLPPLRMNTARRPALAYVVVGPRSRGKFDAAKAQAMGLKGRSRGRVAQGETITETVVDDKGEKVERIFRPEDFLGPSPVPAVMLVLDVPTPGHIPSLLSSFAPSSYFARFRPGSATATGPPGAEVKMIFHLCGNDVLEDPRYKEFMRGFSDDVHHNVASSEHAPDPIMFTSAALQQLSLKAKDEDMFHLPVYSLGASKDLSAVPDLPGTVSAMKAHTAVGLSPYKPLTPDDVAKAAEGLHRTIEVQAKKRSLTAQPDLASSEPFKVISLGTASAMPTKYRNVSGTLVQTADNGSILLDAGEGTWGQLVRFFGRTARAPGGKSVWDVLRELKCIYVSHAHGDHQLGVAKILAMRTQLEPPPESPLFVVGPRKVLLHLQESSDLEDLGWEEPDNGVIPVLSDHLSAQNRNGRQGEETWMDLSRSQRMADQICRSLGLASLSTVFMSHRCVCYGAVIKHRKGWSIVFSGDTMPSDALVAAGENATLLIHEATMAEDEDDLAKFTAHSTVRQAIDVGARMQAQNILLTHFSARYPRMPPALLRQVARKPLPVQHEDESAAPADGVAPAGPVVAVAFDHADYTLTSMSKKRSYFTALEQANIDQAVEEA